MQNVSALIPESSFIDYVQTAAISLAISNVKNKYPLGVEIKSNVVVGYFVQRRQD